MDRYGMSENVKEVGIAQLEEGMNIVAYQGLVEKLGLLDAKSCQWVSHNFPGAKAKVTRGGNEQVVRVDQVKEGDLLMQVEELPSRLHHLVHVTQKLIRELQRQGFKQFLVRPSTKEEQRQQAAREANSFVAKAKKSVAVRENASKAVEQLMDNIAKGVMKLNEVEGLVEQIIESSFGAAMSSLASLKQSDQTYAHCVDVGVIYLGVYKKIMQNKGEKGIFQSEHELLLAAILHDLGKSKVPKEILESTVRFERNSPEMEAMRAHPTHSIELLKELGLPDYCVNLAGYHHVKMDESNFASYPVGFKYADMLYETRLLAIIDIYQALIGRRSYKKSWSAPAAIRFIEALAGVELDEKVWDDFVQAMGYYPVGSLVELDDGSLGFVLKVPQKDLKRPQVVLVRDGSGKDLKPNPMLDLALEKERKIAKDYDPYEIFGEQAMDIFLSLKSV